jgi:hypothetical protein
MRLHLAAAFDLCDLDPPAPIQPKQVKLRSKVQSPRSNPGLLHLRLHPSPNKLNPAASSKPQSPFELPFSAVE